jgi:putative FmdB family regulatory protein
MVAEYLNRTTGVVLEDSAGAAKRGRESGEEARGGSVMLSQGVPMPRTTPRVVRTPYLMVGGLEWEATAMPTYAYRCEQCGETFDRIESISAHGTAKPACPKCGSDKIASVPTAFVAVTGKKS